MGLWAVTAVVLFNYWMVYGIPKRMLEHLSPQAGIKSRCLYGEFGFKSPGVAYLLDDCICVQCITGRLRTFPLKDIQSVREGRWLNGSFLLSPWRVFKCMSGDKAWSIAVREPEPWRTIFSTVGESRSEPV